MEDFQNGEFGQLVQLLVVVDYQLEDEFVPIQVLCMAVKIAQVYILNLKCATRIIVQLMVDLVNGVCGLYVLYRVVEGQGQEKENVVTLFHNIEGKIVQINTKKPKIATFYLVQWMVDSEIGSHGLFALEVVEKVLSEEKDNVIHLHRGMGVKIVMEIPPQRCHAMIFHVQLTVVSQIGLFGHSVHRVVEGV